MLLCFTADALKTTSGTLGSDAGSTSTFCVSVYASGNQGGLTNQCFPNLARHQTYLRGFNKSNHLHPPPRTSQGMRTRNLYFKSSPGDSDEESDLEISKPDDVSSPC